SRALLLPRFDARHRAESAQERDATAVQHAGQMLGDVESDAAVGGGIKAVRAGAHASLRRGWVGTIDAELAILVQAVLTVRGKSGERAAAKEMHFHPVAFWCGAEIEQELRPAAGRGIRCAAVVAARVGAVDNAGK